MTEIVKEVYKLSIYIHVHNYVKHIHAHLYIINNKNYDNKAPFTHSLN